ncbi:transcriptional regulator, ArsR family [Noviherbaspirillum humi]|uniref:Transcriptional regulator, ArsR family n=1 Tax=Noviherbaspirillum humi TaxID=1688639 RepID=A0A239GG91_9BURK|nr:metalloregulator ArsR/SmtB family transcription factor [Noviherbaspirillum humi]SNS68149.1 transcriptional regulator, ArsR family [Noviherbaspirillum humi]
MDFPSAVHALGALANEHRLTVFRLLVQTGPQGLTAGALSSELQIPASSLSFHLKDMLNAGLLQARHEGRQIIYSARFETMNQLIAFLTENCCGGNPCLPAATVSACSASPDGTCP